MSAAEAKARVSAPNPNVKTYNNERLMTLLLAPVISEKGTFIADKYEQVVFRVLQDATKPEIKAAVELMFKVQGKEKRFGRFIGRRRNWKKAYVCLKPGQEINFAAES